MTEIPQIPPAPPVYMAVRSTATNAFAITSFVLGLVWVFGLGSLLAVIFGHISLSQIRQRDEAGRGLAIAGLVLGYIGLGFWVLLFLIGVIAGLGDQTHSTYNDYGSVSG